MATEQPHPTTPSSSRQKKSGKTMDSGYEGSVTQSSKAFGSTSTADDSVGLNQRRLLLKPETQETSGEISSKFQTTGAFLTRTASKLLGSQSALGGDCNIHGYVYGKPVKVRNIDGTWYFGTMVDLANGKIKIHFDGWGTEWDEWLASDSRRLQLLNEEGIEQREAFLMAISNESSTVPPPQEPVPKERHRTKKTPSKAAQQPVVRNSSPSNRLMDGKQPQVLSTKRKMSLSEQQSLSKELPTAITTPVGRVEKRVRKNPAEQQAKASHPKPATTPLLRPIVGQEHPQTLTSTSVDPTSIKGVSSDILKNVHIQERSTLIPSETKSIQENGPAIDSSEAQNHTSITQPEGQHVVSRAEGQSEPVTRPLNITIQYSDLADKTELSIVEHTHSGASTSQTEQKPEMGQSAPAPTPILQPVSRPSLTKQKKARRGNKGPSTEEASKVSSINHDQLPASTTKTNDQKPCDGGARIGNGEHVAEDGSGGSNGENKENMENMENRDDSVDKESSPEPLLYPTIGNPIQLNLEPRDVVQFEFSDEENEIRNIIHRVLDTGRVKNRPIIHPIDNIGSSRSIKAATTRKTTQDDEDGQQGGNQEGDEGGCIEDKVDTPRKLPTKAAERFAAVIEARARKQGYSSKANAFNTPIVRKDSEALNQVREMATRNMSNTPIIQFVRQVIYDDIDKARAFENRKQTLATALAGSKLAKHRRFHPLSKKILGSLDMGDISDITFNEAGYIETTASLKAKTVVKPHNKTTKKRKERPVLKDLTDSYFLQDENQINGKGIFESLRSLTGTKKQKRILADDHIMFLKRAMVPDTRIKARDKQMDWLTAVIREVKNSRVLVHYEGYHECFNEWIDINSERLKYDPALEQNPPKSTMGDGQCTSTPSVESHHASQRPPTLGERPKEPKATAPSETDMAAIADSVPSEDGATEVPCVQCQVKISQFRIYCMYCEVQAKAQGSERSPFNLCLWCFSNAFPEGHDHPRSSFATKVIVGPQGVRPVKGGIITRFEKDLMDTSFKEPDKPDAATIQAMQLEAMMRLESDQPFITMDQWRNRKVCAFCNDDGTSKDHFIGPYPFLLASMNRFGDTKKRHFWAHDACARHSPEVIQGKDGTWYNVSTAMRRGRTVKCASCKEKGATIGCFDPKCGRSFHVPCTGKPMSHFEDGVIFWCPQHERALLQKDAYDDTFSCDRCSKILGVDPWQTCVKCSDDYFHTFDLCLKCFALDQIDHEHEKDDFKLTSLELTYQERQEKEAAQVPESDESIPVKKKPTSYKPKMRSLSRMGCSYCWSTTSVKWRKAGPLSEGPMQSLIRIMESSGALESDSSTPLSLKEENDRGVGTYATSAEDYSHTPYLTRTAVSADRFDNSSSQAVYLDSYGPAENQLFSLPFDTTYYDIPGRAPRWATHSGTDYHGTWLPQTVRRAVLKYTNPNDKILSNFLGRGTDAIECFLLGRCCTGVDINPAAITLSIRNCSFAIPPNSTIKAEHRPTILQGDSRKLTGPLFENESFDHVLSHPPYKDCVAYSTHIDGDLSRFGNSVEFQREMRNVVRETYRLLKMGRRCTLGIGDNREHCFYIPVSFQLIRQYINEGFELEEFIVKRQRYCAMFGLGTYLCVQFDFLCFTHEFIATLRKIPKEQIDTMILEPDFALLDNLRITSTTRAVPSCPVERKSVVMGSVWTFKPTKEYDFPTLCVSRMVERFGKNESNWEEFKLEFKLKDPEEVQVEGGIERPIEVLPIVDDEMVSYERDRLQQIQENNKMLLALGLTTELSESSDDIGHQIKISKDVPCYPPPAQTVLRVVAHIPGALMRSDQISIYRTAIMHLAVQALENLPISGTFIVGTQDIRAENGKLIPLAMLVLEDVIRVVGDDCLKLKELIEAVPDGYQKDRRKITCIEEYQDEICTPNAEIPNRYLPIVHACYLVFTKVKEKGSPSTPETASPAGTEA
ncbi:hypothetical protein BGX34_005534 [Mortierella sp. NVP85]|nr:hypothetical protein BGX34_005534 [Mortierella sp. NVP85]